MESFDHFELRILHISDLHERGDREEALWRRRRVLGEAWERNVADLQADGKIDLVCFTGDAADWGKPEEYAAATDFFVDLLARLELPKERLFLVPGNHDIDRGIHAEAWRSLREVFDQADGYSIAQWLAGYGKTPPGARDEWREQVLERQQAYRNWMIEKLGRAELDPSKHAHGRLGYRIPVSIPGLPFPVQVIGLDTAWLAGEKYEGGRLRFTDEQVMRHATDQDGKTLPGFRVALCHHPLWDMADREHCSNLLAEHVDVLLRGHLHSVLFEDHAEPDRCLRELASGCLYEGRQTDQYRNGSQVLTIRLNSAGRPIELRPWLRSWSPEGHWYNDDGRYRHSYQGRLVWHFPHVRKKDGDNPYDASRIALPPNFVGRKYTLQVLGQALEKHGSISIVGHRRIGKSSLLHTWEKEARKRGRVTRLLDGREKESHSIADFVMAITGEQCDNDADHAADKLKVWARSQTPTDLPPLLLIDEADIFLRQFEYRFFERLGKLMDRICLVMATHDPLDVIYEKCPKGSPFTYQPKLEFLGLLESEAAEELIQRGGAVLDGKDHELMRRWAGRHPYYIQLLGYHLIEAREHGASRINALDRAHGEATVRLLQLFRNHLNENERDALRAVMNGNAVRHRGLRLRGILDDTGHAFGEVLADCLGEAGI